jgi:hypothetical protein
MVGVQETATEQSGQDLAEAAVPTLTRIAQRPGEQGQSDGLKAN